MTATATQTASSSATASTSSFPSSTPTATPSTNPSTANTSRISFSSSRSSSSSRSRGRTPPPSVQSKDHLPDLIARFGNASATTWLEKRYSIWTSEKSTPESPRIQGFLAAGHHNIAWGNPVCKSEDLAATAEEFIEWTYAHHKKPVYACVDHNLEEVLAKGVDSHGGWSTLTCIKEDVIYPETAHPTKDLNHNVRRANKEGVTVQELRVGAPTYLPEESRKIAIEEGLQRWKAARQEYQNVATASLDPWLDSKHRRYWIARGNDKQRSIIGVTILAPVGENTYQIKNSVQFPEAPKGTSELLLSKVIDDMRFEEKHLTFGTSAAEEMHAEHNLKGWKIRVMTKAYRSFVGKHGLMNRGQFRSKFGSEGEPLYICYPPHGFGPLGWLSMLKKLKAD